MEVTDEKLAESVAELVRIPSVNPAHAGPVSQGAGSDGEGALAEHLADRFDGLGADEVVLDEVVDGRPNVYARFAGRSDRTVVLDVHTDTVSVEHMTDPPFDGRIADGRVWGRGALDTKASLGVILGLLESWRADGLRPDPNLLVVGSASEEAGGLIGAVRFRQWAEERRLAIDEAVIAEPTRLAPIHGHKGGAILRITALGRAAHSATPEVGANAIEAMTPVIAAMQAEHRRLVALPPTTELGTATLTVVTIEGGSGSNVVPASCSMVVSRRVVPGEDADEVLAQLAAIATEACPLPIETEPIGAPSPDGRRGIDAFYEPADSPLVQRLAGWAGTTPQVAPFGTNALRYVGFVPDMAVFGPGSIDDAHQATECVAVADLVRTAEVHERWLRPG